MLLIAAHGRSGTHYTSAVLGRLGLDVPHEKLGKDGAASWKHIAPGEFTVIGKRRVQVIPDIAYDHIFQQTRHPLAVLASAQTFSESTWVYMEKVLHYAAPDRVRWPSGRFGPFSRQDTSFGTLIRRGMRTWIGWNGLIEERAQWRYRIETFPEIFPEFLERLGLPQQPLPEVPREAHDSRVSRENHRKVSVDDLYAVDRSLADELLAMASRYGYRL